MPSLTNQVSYNLCVVEDLFYGQPNNDDTEVKFIKLIVESDDYQRVAHSVTVLTPSPVITIQDDYQRVAHSVTVLTPSPVITIQLSLIWYVYLSIICYVQMSFEMVSEKSKRV
ncbi:hypothetical protein CsSME_00028916 [Camellia sinensis var. sinensis]